MNRPALVGALVSILSAVLTSAALAVSPTVHDPALGEVAVTCDNHVRRDYRTKMASSVAMTDAYARERGADKGLVRLVDRGWRHARRFGVPRRDIGALIRVTLQQTEPDEAALIYTRRGVVLVHTSTADAGVFTVADVYRLSRSPDAPLDRRLVRDEDLSHMLDLALAAYDPLTGRCVVPR